MEYSLRSYSATLCTLNASVHTSRTGSYSMPARYSQRTIGKITCRWTGTQNTFLICNSAYVDLLSRSGFCGPIPVARCTRTLHASCGALLCCAPIAASCPTSQAPNQTWSHLGHNSAVMTLQLIHCRTRNRPRVGLTQHSLSLASHLSH